MFILYLIILVFSALSMYFVWHDHQKGEIGKNAFRVLMILEAVILLISVWLLIRS